MNEEELVLCTVEKVTNTITFVRLPDGREGTIISSEIAPGRIKFMRQYVVPNKKVVCKVLRDDGKNIHLSLRRVNNKEKKDVMQRFKQELAVSVALKQILGDKGEEVKNKIIKDFGDLISFTDKARQDSKVILKFFSEKDSEKIIGILVKKRKVQEISKKIKIKCLEEDGIKKIKEVLNFEDPSVRIIYLSAGIFDLRITVEDFKEGKKKLNDMITEIESRAKRLKCEFEYSD